MRRPCSNGNRYLAAIGLLFHAATFYIAGRRAEVGFRFSSQGLRLQAFMFRKSGALGFREFRASEDALQDQEPHAPGTWMFMELFLSLSQALNPKPP